MCFDPATLALTAVGGGLSAAGGMADQRAKNRDARTSAFANVQQMQQDADVAKMRTAVANQYVERQKGYTADNQGAFNGAVGQFAAPAVEGNRATAEADRNAFLQKQVGTGPESVVTNEAASPAAQSAMAKALGEAFTSAQAGGQRSARLSSFGDSLRTGNEAAQSSARAIDTTNNFARGDISMLPADQDLQEFQMRKRITKAPANNSNPSGTLKGLGSLVGSLAGAYGGKIGAGAKSLFSGFGGASGVTGGSMAP